MTFNEEGICCPHCDDDDVEKISECVIKDVAGNTCHLVSCLCGCCGRRFTVEV